MAVDPRVRGEYVGLAFANITPAGASARARGIRPSVLGSSGENAVHPRVRGEYEGIGLLRVFLHRCIRACAGNTSPLGMRARASRCIRACAGNTSAAPRTAGNTLLGTH